MTVFDADARMWAEYAQVLNTAGHFDDALATLERELQASLGRREVWAKHPNPDAYLHLNARFMQELDASPKSPTEGTERR